MEKLTSQIADPKNVCNQGTDSCTKIQASVADPDTQKCVAKDAFSNATGERRITRSMAKSAAVLDNRQVIPKKRKTKRETQIPFLPEEILFKIFLLLPAKVLQEVMSAVCRTWREVIRDPVFTKSHFSQLPRYSPYGILKFNDSFDLYSINKDETAWNLTRRERIKQKYLSDGVGFILTANRNEQSIISLLNSITKKLVTLPRIPIKCSDDLQHWAVGYSPSTLKYKVMCSDYCSKRVYILTVGVDKQWREIVDTRTAVFTWDSYLPPIGERGFIYWPFYHNHRVIILLDLEKEIFYEVDFSRELEGHLLYPRFYPMSSDGTVTIAVPHYIMHWQWCFWELVNLKNGGEWLKLGKLDLKSKSVEINTIMGLANYDEIVECLCPVAVIKGKDEVIFEYPFPNRFFAYNFKTKTVSKSFGNGPEGLKLMFANSLVDSFS